jgi:hypothetical protein
MNQIIEYHGKPQPGNLLYDKLKEKNAEYNDDVGIGNNDWHLVVYLQSDQDLKILYSASSNRRIVVKQSFAECLKMINCRDFNQLLMLLTLFPWYTGKRQLKKLLTPAIEPATPLNLILAETNGWIVYRQQFEMIVQLAMMINAREAIATRKAYNAKKTEVFSLFEKYELFGENLSDIIHNRCITRLVQDPVFRIRGAVLLYEYFMSKSEPDKISKSPD